MHFDLTDLRLFLMIVDAGSITGGAERAGLALASASTRVRGMEAQAGVLLLERGRRGVQPTAAGTVLLHHARSVIQQMERMRGDLGAFARGLKGRVRLVANTAGMVDVLPEALARFIASHPTVDLDLDEAPSVDVVRAVALETADFGIAADHADMSGLERHPFHDDRLMLAVPPGHPLSGTGRIAFAETLEFDFVGLAGDSALQRHLADHAARAGGRIRLRARVRSLDLLCRMVSAGAGLAIVPRAALRQCRTEPPLALIPLTDVWATRKLLIVVRRSEALSPYARSLIEHLLRGVQGDPHEHA